MAFTTDTGMILKEGGKIVINLSNDLDVYPSDLARYCIPAKNFGYSTSKPLSCQRTGAK